MSAAMRMRSERAAAFEVVAFEPWHLAHIEARTPDRLELAQIGDPVERGVAYAAAGPAFTGLREGRVAFCLGAVELWPGVGEAWSVTSALIETLPVSFHRLVLRMLDEQQAHHHCRRLQASVRQDHGVSVRWLHRLGFTYEGRMEAYGPDGSAHLRFARFRDDSIVPLRRPDATASGQKLAMA